MAFTSLLDGGLSVLIDGIEYVDYCHEMKIDSTHHGDGGCTFWIEVDDPFHVRTQFEELHHGATVVVTHTVDAVTTGLYNGFIISEPRTGYAGEKAVVNIQCGGALEVAKGRTDMGFIFTDADTSQWFENKGNPKCYSFNVGQKIDIRVAKDTHVPNDRAGIIGYVPYMGAQYILNDHELNGVRRITGTVSYDLQDDLRVALIWWPEYKGSQDVSTYRTIVQWSKAAAADDRRSNVKLDEAVPSTIGAGYVALAMWATKTGGIKTTKERHLTVDDVVIYTNRDKKSVDGAMLTVANFIGLHGSQDVHPIGNVLPSLLVRPYVDPASALASFAAQADCLVEWGYFLGEFRAKPMLTDPHFIYQASNCYTVSMPNAEVVWDVAQHPEDGIPKAVRLIYGHTSKSDWPAGTPDAVIAPASPGFGVGTAFSGSTASVMTVDFSEHRYTNAHAKKVAKTLASHLGLALSSGTVRLTGKTVPIHDGGTKPVPYIRGADWISCAQSNAGPLYITSCSLDVDTGYVDLEVGLAMDDLIDQIQAAGGRVGSATHWWHPKKPAVQLHQPSKKG